MEFIVESYYLSVIKIHSLIKLLIMANHVIEAFSDVIQNCWSIVQSLFKRQLVFVSITPFIVPVDPLTQRVG